jgi:hypothetical protein
LPTWFYLFFSHVKLVAPFKQQTSPGASPEVRPIGIGECLRRTITRAVIADRKEVLAGHLLPQQVAVGVPFGIGLLVFGLRAMLEMHPDWVVVKLDLRNAYNEIKRARILQRLLEAETLKDLAPLFWATYGQHPAVILAAPDMPQAHFDSSEGVQQGDRLASACFCVGIHPEVQALDAELLAGGGAARFDMDDGYAVGPPDVVFRAVESLSDAVASLGLDIRWDKCYCYGPSGGLASCDHRPAQFPVGQEPSTMVRSATAS